VTASAAAGLAITSLVLNSKDPAYAEKSLKYAAALYKFAAKYPASVGTTTGGLYTSEYAYDDLAWAALWLYLATGTQSYLDDILGPNGNGGGWLDGFPGFVTTVFTDRAAANCWAESATYDWNSVRTGRVPQDGADPARPEPSHGQGHGDHRARRFDEVAEWAAWP
jgi:endoglucanase